MSTVATYLIIFIIYLGACLLIGFVAERKSLKTTRDYFIGSRQIGPWVLGFTYTATLISAGSFIGGAGFVYGLGWPSIVFSMGATSIGVIIAWALLGNRLRYISNKLATITLPDIMLERYESKLIPAIAAIGTIVFFIPFMVAQILGAGIVFHEVFKLPYWLGVVVFGGVIVIYTALGGFKAVAWTDLFQGLIMVFGFCIITPVIVIKLGGLSNMLGDYAAKYPQMLTVTSKYWTPAMIISWCVMLCVGINLAMPHTVLRFLAIKNRDVAKKAFPIAITSHVWLFVNTAIVAIGGALLFPGLKNPEAVFPHMVVNLFPNVFGGLILVAIFAAMMSTVDSVLIMVGSAVGRDIYQRLINPSSGETKSYIYSVIAVFVIGAISLALSIKPPGSVMFLMAMAVSCVIPLYLYPLLGATHFKRINARGALWGMIAGAVIGGIWSGFLGWKFVLPALPAMVGATIGTIIGTYTSPPPRKEIIEKFWGKE
jgi:SSS family transporter